MSNKEEKKNELTEANSNQIIIASGDELPAYLKTDSNRGSEDVGIEDLTIPRLEIVQALSPCRKKTNAAYIEGCEEGQLYNSITREIYGDKVFIIPVVFKKQWLIWKDRDAGGGFKGAYDTAELAAERLIELEEENAVGPFESVDTAQHICLLLKPNGKIEEIAISMAKSKMKVSRKFNSLVRINGGDRFSRVYEVRTVEDKSEKGEYINLDIKTIGFPSEEMYRKAEILFDDIKSGKREVKVSDKFDEDTVMEGDVKI